MPKLHTLAFEIGTEEIPAFDLHSATGQLGTLVHDALAAERIDHGAVEVYTTPRRLIVIVSDIADSTEAVSECFRGPAASIAFDAQGNPTKAALGFARGKGVDVSELELREEGNTSYVFATRTLPARVTFDLLPELLAGIIPEISWPKSCRWGTTSEYFSRPVRWLCALLDDQVIPVQFAGLCAGRQSFGHRFLSPGPHEIKHAAQLVDVLREAHVVPSEDEREALIREGVSAVEQRIGAHAQLPPKTLREVVNLCEQPSVLVGSFDPEFLEVPEEIIVDAMLMHQRYFPLYDDAGKLTNQFIVVSNGNPDCATTIIEGNERVVRARLSDAKFFYEEDLKHPLSFYVDRLDEVVFQERLGTMRDKTERIERLVDAMAASCSLAADEQEDAMRAAHLAKADLVTNAVVEFTSVQGIMGSYYAHASGEPGRVSTAIADHYRPRFAGDALPQTRVGAVVAAADKLDTICGLFVVGQAPTGSSDPFALRRAAIGIINIMQSQLPLVLADSIDSALGIYADSSLDFDRADVRSQIIEFFVTRTTVMLKESGIQQDVIDAVLACGVCEPLVIIERARALDALRTNDPELIGGLAQAFARANNLRDASLGVEVAEAGANEPELKLLRAIDVTAAQVDTALAQEAGYQDALHALSALREPIDTFFEDVMIMDEDISLRENRLRLLNRFVAVFAQLADFSMLQA